MNSLAALATELQSIWHREIPLAAAIDVQVASCTDGELVVRAPLEPNRNLHGTAFAGSLFSVCALTGWGMTWLALRQRSLGGLIVIADSRIQYRKAVSGEILCRCVAERPALDAAFASLAATGRAKVPLDLHDRRKRQARGHVRRRVRRARQARTLTAGAPRLLRQGKAAKTSHVPSQIILADT